MSYTATSISDLAGTIGFGETSINISGANKTGSSGMVFRGFHQLVTIDAIKSTLDESISSVSSKFDGELTQIREDAAKATLADVLDLHVDYIESEAYDEVISDRLNLLRKPFGYAVVITCIEMMMASGRYNIKERTVRETYATLKMELEGAKNAQGKTVSQGIVSKYRYAVKQAQKVIFQSKPIVNAQQDW